MSNIINPTMLSGSEVLPIIEGGKGIGVTDGGTAGHFAKAGAIGTFSGVCPKHLDDNGEHIPLEFTAKNRVDRHREFVDYSIKGAVSQAKRAFDIARGKGKIHMNVLWESGGAHRVIEEVLEKAQGLINGVTAGAGMPYRLAEMTAKHKVYYYPIVSSMRAFKILWNRSYKKFSEWLGGVVYECPWKAGGHNGLSNAENPLEPQSPYERLVALRTFMDSVNLQEVPIVLAGGVWHLNDFKDYINNPDVGKIAFQFGTRPIYTQESPVSKEWKERLFTLREGDVFLNRFSPTGFYSSAVRNQFIIDLTDLSKRQVSFTHEEDGDHTVKFVYNSRGRFIWITPEDHIKVQQFIEAGYTEMMKTPDNTAVFASVDQKNKILKDQRDCVGCLSACRFSNWMEDKAGVGHFSTDKMPDPRSFCIQKTLRSAVETSDIENDLMFSGSQSFNFAQDEWYQGGKFMPTIQQLVDRIMSGY